MSAGVELSQFFEMFYDETDELLAEMERLLLEIDISRPDADHLNGIFRAAHSIKGGAATFGCFGHLAQTTHLLENLLDLLRCGEMTLRKDMVDLFLDAKDIMEGQVAAYRNSAGVDTDAYDRIGAQLRELALEHAASKGGTPPGPERAQSGVGDGRAAIPAADLAGQAPQRLRVSVNDIDAGDAQALRAEMALLGDIVGDDYADGSLSIWMDTTCPAEDVEAVCCFVVNPGQVRTALEAAPSGTQPVRPDADPGPARDAGSAEPLPASSVPVPPSPAPSSPAGPAASQKDGPPDAAIQKGVGTIRVGVEKVDQIINLVGELVITQAMLVQTASTLDPVQHDRLLNGVEQLERNARDLQEAVMSIRMMPMDYVFSRFPRLVREGASRLGKRIRLITHGQATELDKSLIERIVDPLTHLVRNSLDHGIEPPEARASQGKNPEGQLVLSARHNGGQIVIEISDDGAGLNRERILAKAAERGLAAGAAMSDEEVWQLVFAPGFSTAEQVTDISGRGVGMDVVRRNIQGMGGHVQILSRAGRGTTIRIMLPLTLAILDGMSVRVGGETFILPLSHVAESMQPAPDQIRSISDSDQVLYVRGEYLPLVALHEVFLVAGAQTDVARSIAVILQAEDARFALLVDHLVGQHQVVVKNLESNYKKVPGVSAATILGDGSVALIVDVFALMRMTRGKAARQALAAGENNA